MIPIHLARRVSKRKVRPNLKDSYLIFQNNQCVLVKGKPDRNLDAAKGVFSIIKELNKGTIKIDYNMEKIVDEAMQESDNWVKNGEQWMLKDETKCPEGCDPNLDPHHSCKRCLP